MFDSVKHAAKTNKNLPDDGQVEAGKYAYVGKSENSIKKKAWGTFKTMLKNNLLPKIVQQEKKKPKKMCVRWGLLS